jgi:hypothetical protein
LNVAIGFPFRREWTAAWPLSDAYSAQGTQESAEWGIRAIYRIFPEAAGRPPREETAVLRPLLAGRLAGVVRSGLGRVGRLLGGGLCRRTRGGIVCF